MSTPDIEIGEVEGQVEATTEVGATESFEAQSTTFEPNHLTELLRRLNSAGEQVHAGLEHCLPGDQAVLISLCVQIRAVAQLFVDSAEAAAAAVEQEAEAFPIVED